MGISKRDTQANEAITNWQILQAYDYQKGWDRFLQPTGLPSEKEVEKMAKNLRVKFSYILIANEIAQKTDMCQIKVR